MENRISHITLGVRDMAATAEFYEVLGWTRVESEDGIVAFDLIDQTLGLYPLEKLAEDIGLPVEALGVSLPAEVLGVSLPVGARDPSPLVAPLEEPEQWVVTEVTIHTLTSRLI